MNVFGQLTKGPAINPIWTNLFSSSRRLTFSVLEPRPDPGVINVLVTVVCSVNDGLFDLWQAGEGQVKVKAFSFHVVVFVVVVKLVRRCASAPLLDCLANISDSDFKNTTVKILPRSTLFTSIGSTPCTGQCNGSNKKTIFQKCVESALFNYISAGRSTHCACHHWRPNLPGSCCICLEQSAGVSTRIAVTASFSQQTENRASCPVVQLFWLRASHCTDYHVTSLLFLRVRPTCPCSLRTYATLKFIRSSSSSSSSSSRVEFNKKNYWQSCQCMKYFAIYG